MNFKLAVDTGGGSGATGGTDDGLNDGAAGGAGSGMMLHGGGDDEAATESRLQHWTGEEETSIKEPTWYVFLLLHEFIHGAHVNFFVCCSDPLMADGHGWKGKGK
jgi:hypothetical protein